MVGREAMARVLTETRGNCENGNYKWRMYGSVAMSSGGEMAFRRPEKYQQAGVLGRCRIIGHEDTAFA